MKKNRTKRFATRILAGLLMLVGGILPLGISFAAPEIAETAESVDRIAITLSPTKQYLELEQGKTTTGEVVVMNDGTFDSKLRIYATPYQVAPDYTTNDFDTENNWTQVSRWITFGPNNESELVLDLAVGVSETVIFAVNVPNSVPFGGQYAAIMVETVGDETDSGVQAVHRVASLIYSEVAGNTIEKGEIIARDWRGWYRDPLIATNLTIKNSGNIDFTVDNILTITDFFSGKVICEAESRTLTMLPDTERGVDLACKTDKSIALYRVTQRSTFLNDQISTETRVVLIMPIYVVVLIFVVFAALIVLLIILIRKRILKRREG